MLTFIVAFCSVLLLLQSSLAEHAGNLKHKHPLRHGLEARRVPAAFDALQWEKDARDTWHSAHSNPVEHTPATDDDSHVFYLTIWQTVWITADPTHKATSSFEHGSTTTLMTSILTTPASVSDENSTTLDASSNTLVATSSLTTSFVYSVTTSTYSGVIVTSTPLAEMPASASSSYVAEMSLAASTIPSVVVETPATLAVAPESSSTQLLSSASIEVEAKKKKPKTTESTAMSSTKSSTVAHHSSSSYPSAMLIPTATYSLIHGAAQSSPATQYIKCAANSAKLPKLASNLLEGGMNQMFETSSPLYNATGVMAVTAANENELTDLDTIPYMSRDGGHGGVINGHKIFYFADTETFTTPTEDKEGTFTGMVSNSIAFDVGNNAFDGKALTLQDPPGAFINNMGAQRGFVPMTEDESAWSVGNGWSKRYAIWPWGSLVALTNETSLLYAPIVVQIGSAFDNAGTTLVSISVTDDGQPIVDRPVPVLFAEDSTQYGVFGGLRSWGPSGVGGSDGKVYVFGTSAKGLLLARVDATSVEEKSSYEYWDNSTSPSTWSSTPTTSVFFAGGWSSGDIFYSPHHGTFIAVLQDEYIDSKFYYRYLLAPSFIYPDYSAEVYTDMVEDIYNYEWSDSIFLIDTPILAEGHYTYDGGVHQGYFDDEDIINGGNRMLIAWTAPTGKPAASLSGGYQIWTAEIKWE